MSRFNNPLKNVRVASPCNADWDQMFGNDRARFCQHCTLNVYNLSSMTRDEAELLIGNTEGRLCVRYYKRSDGSIITNDCPVGLRAVRRRMSNVARAVCSLVLSFFAGLGIYAFRKRSEPVVSMGVMAEKPVVLGMMAVEPEVLPAVQEPPPPQVMLGKVLLIKQKRPHLQKRMLRN